MDRKREYMYQKLDALYWRVSKVYVSSRTTRTNANENEINAIETALEPLEREVNEEENRSIYFDHPHSLYNCVKRAEEIRENIRRKRDQVARRREY